MGKGERLERDAQDCGKIHILLYKWIQKEKQEVDEHEWVGETPVSLFSGSLFPPATAAALLGTNHQLSWCECLGLSKSLISRAAFSRVSQTTC